MRCASSLPRSPLIRTLPGLHPPAAAAVTAAGPGTAVADAWAEVREAADWCSRYNGGGGAVREACEFILLARGDWPSRLAEFA